jgi:hypothetical protein
MSGDTTISSHSQVVLNNSMKKHGKLSPSTIVSIELSAIKLRITVFLMLTIFTLLCPIHIYLVSL